MMSAAQTRPRPRLVPEDGAENPAFAAIDTGDTVHATVLFSPPLADAELDLVERLVLAWFAGAEWGGALPELVDEGLTPAALHLAVTGVRSARAALGSLVEALVGARVAVHRVVLARHRADGDRAALVRVMDPASTTQVRYADEEAWWRACFDPAAPPPLSEDFVALAQDDNAILEVARTTFAERRGMPLHVAGLRICWGLGELGFDEPDTRTREVARVLKMALRARFGGAEGHSVPVPYDRQVHAGGAVDRIVARDRVGYSCAFHADDLREFLHGHAFRYREYELMLAARDALGVLGLEPVVCWRRFSGRYVLQLWERSTTRAYAAA
jgi:hypothetical protein